MILYRLLCSHEHTFEAWFRDSAAYDTMAAGGAVECPVCGDTSVRKALMAPAIARHRNRPAAPPQPQAAAAGAPAEVAVSTAAPPTPPAPPAGAERLAEVHRHVAEAIGRIQKVVEEHCDYVGDRFAEEARRIHYGETDPRGIYGETTPDEAAELREEGVEFASIPWRRRVS